MTSQAGAPGVSVVIPTRGRPSLLLRAVRSALAQTYADLEVIVSLDGPDPQTVAAVSAIEDPRLRLIVAEAPAGAPAARNAGFVAARGEWIGLLDDDDEWLPHKLEKQLAAVAASNVRDPIVATALVARSPLGDEIWPREAPPPDLPISEYLMVRRGVFAGDRVIQTSTVLARRSLFMALPYKPGLRRHQDWDWLLRALERPGTALLFVNEPEVVWYIEENRGSISQSAECEVSLDWIASVRNLVTDRAYASFLLLFPGAQAARSGRYDLMMPLLLEALRTAPVRAGTIGTYLLYWILPVALRRRLRQWRGRARA